MPILLIFDLKHYFSFVAASYFTYHIDSNRSWYHPSNFNHFWAPPIEFNFIKIFDRYFHWVFRRVLWCNKRYRPSMDQESNLHFIYFHSAALQIPIDDFQNWRPLQGITSLGGKFKHKLAPVSEYPFKTINGFCVAASSCASKPRENRHWSQQSPINIDSHKLLLQKDGAITLINYDHVPPIDYIIENNGHTAQLGRTSLDVDVGVNIGNGINYQFLQLHFHWGPTSIVGSEHLIDFQMHIVHANPDSADALADPNGLAVLGVLFEMNNAPVAPFALETLVPKSKALYRYEGSLTTPPCSEAVIWTVFKETLSISEAQLAEFRQLIDNFGQQMLLNFRPVNPLFGRKVFFQPDSKQTHYRKDIVLSENRVPFCPPRWYQYLVWLMDYQVEGDVFIAFDFADFDRPGLLIERIFSIQDLEFLVFLAVTYETRPHLVVQLVFRNSTPFKNTVDPVDSHMEVRWTYKGPFGVKSWPKNFPLCDDMRQSPININSYKLDFKEDGVITFNNYDYIPPMNYIIENNGHTGKYSETHLYHHTLLKRSGRSDQKRYDRVYYETYATYKDQDVENTYNTGSILGTHSLDAHVGVDIGNGIDYEFMQLHFHWGPRSNVGSEHLINYRAFPLEMHIVHANPHSADPLADPDGLAVLGILFEVILYSLLDIDIEDIEEIDKCFSLSQIGAKNEALQPIIDSLKSIINEDDTAPVAPFALETLVPKSKALYRYKGSLTTPPCSEAVVWTVFQETLSYFRRTGADNSYTQHFGTPTSNISDSSGHCKLRLFGHCPTKVAIGSDVIESRESMRAHCAIRSENATHRQN
ncbi:Carbonic anhydrase 15 [Nymphon striatum]|nr:Carbonic anhydrase 15 [Nymphon striatum]